MTVRREPSDTNGWDVVYSGRRIVLYKRPAPILRQGRERRIDVAGLPQVRVCDLDVAVCIKLRVPWFLFVISSRVI